MAHDVSRQRERELHEARASAGEPARSSAGFSVDGVLALLVGGADADDVLRAYPGLTRDDLGAMLTGALLQEDEPTADSGPSFISPQEFYREALRREDIRRILAALAK